MIFSQFVGGGKELTVPQYFLAGSLTAVPITLVESPVELLKIKLMTQVPHEGEKGTIISLSLFFFPFFCFFFANTTE